LKELNSECIKEERSRGEIVLEKRRKNLGNESEFYDFF
jgi:hypothetical protein